MFNPIVVMFERAAGIVRWVDEDALDLAGELLFKGFECKEIVAEEEAVIEQIVARRAAW